MKGTIFFLIGTFTFLLVQTVSAGILHGKEAEPARKIFTFAESDPVGVWDYTVSGAGSEYEKGLLFIRKENDDYVVEVQLSTGTLTGQEVRVEGDSVTFNIIIEGTERVSVVLQVADDTISGESYSTQGTYKIMGKRRVPEE